MTKSLAKPLYSLAATKTYVLETFHKSENFNECEQVSTSWLVTVSVQFRKG